MKLFDSLKARLGINAMSVDLLFENRPYKKGEQVAGFLEIVGGSCQQKSLGVLVTLLIEEKDVRITDFGNYKVHPSFTIDSGEVRKIPFMIELPDEMPVTSDTISIVLIVNAVTMLSIDSRNKISIKIYE